MCAHRHECKGPKRPEVLDPLGTGVAGTCEPPKVGARIRLRFLEKEQFTHSAAEPSF